MNEANDGIESLGVKEPVLIPGLGKIFWDHGYRGSKYTKEVDFLDPAYVPKWAIRYSVPQVNNILESEFQFFSLNLILNKPLGENVLNFVAMSINNSLGTTDVGYINEFSDNATIDQLSLPKNLVLALESLLVNLNGGEMTCCYYNVEADDDPLLVAIEFVHCETSEISPDDLLLTIASVISSWLASIRCV